jgi:hypothetical protein
LAAAEIAQSGNNDPMDRTGASGDHLLKGFSVCNQKGELVRSWEMNQMISTSLDVQIEQD